MHHPSERVEAVAQTAQLACVFDQGRSVRLSGALRLGNAAANVFGNVEATEFAGSEGSWSDCLL